MRGLYIEQRSLKGKTSLSWDLVHHIYARGTQGKFVVVTGKPVELLAATKKQWLKLMRQVQRERSSTLDAVRIGELSRQIAGMQIRRFSAKPPQEEVDADVSFATVEQLLAWAPACHTLYITCELTKEQLHLITAWMPRGGLVVIYE